MIVIIGIYFYLELQLIVLVVLVVQLDHVEKKEILVSKVKKEIEEIRVIEVWEDKLIKFIKLINDIYKYHLSNLNYYIFCNSNMFTINCDSSSFIEKINIICS